MKNHAFKHLIPIALLLLLCGGAIITVQPAAARKVSTKLKAPSRQAKAEEENSRIYPSNKEEFEEVANSLAFTAYDKKASSAKETFFVSNQSECPLSSIELEITYLSSSGRQIHKRKVELREPFPAKEMKKVDISSWDTQKSFHYVNSAPSAKGSTPYTVRFRLVSFGKAPVEDPQD